MTKKTAQTKAKTKAKAKKGKKKMDMKELNTLKENYEKLLREKGQEIMKGAVEEFFKANPKITAVTWTQYTPYFNDGDTCQFGVNDPAFSVSASVNVNDVPSYPDDDGIFFTSYGFTKFDLEDEYYKGKDWAIEHNNAIAEAAKTAGVDGSTFTKADKSFRETIGAAPEDLFLAAFGDHMKVVITPEQIYTEEVEHD